MDNVTIMMMSISLLGIAFIVFDKITSKKDYKPHSH